MELHQLRYFRAVARFRSFTRAAEHERISQPSISQQIRKLEDELGSRLFDRLGRRIRLTAFGARFQEHALRILNNLEDARRDVKAMLGLHTGAVFVGVIPTVAPYILPQALRRCSKAFPKITIDIVEDLTHGLLKGLADGDLDLALLGLPVAAPELVAEPLWHERMLLAVPKDHPLWRRGRRVSLDEVVQEPFLLLKDGHCFRDDVLEVCKRARLNPHVVFEGGQLDTLMAMVAAGAGVTLLPEMASHRYRNHEDAGLIELTPPQPARTIGIVRAKGKFLTPAAKAFIEVLHKLAASQKQGKRKSVSRKA
ncbi:MAG TPA: LysR substrate-binding domain-containing protein [Terriglobia bacterium]|nr:LysR substrate-binding domain-containing protein [Terriglobia bacterium]